MVIIIQHLDCDEISKVMPVNQSNDNVTLSVPIEGEDIFNSLYMETSFDLEGNFIENYALGNSISYIPDMFDWLHTPLERIEI